MAIVVNRVGREVPTYVENLGGFRPYAGVFATPPSGRQFAPAIRQLTGKKVLPSLRAAIEASGLKSDQTISFHHHFRNGDLLAKLTISY